LEETSSHVLKPKDYNKAMTVTQWQLLEFLWHVPKYFHNVSEQNVPPVGPLALFVQSFSLSNQLRNIILGLPLTGNDQMRLEQTLQNAICPTVAIIEPSIPAQKEQRKMIQWLIQRCDNNRTSYSTERSRTTAIVDADQTLVFWYLFSQALKHISTSIISSSTKAPIAILPSRLKLSWYLMYIPSHFKMINGHQ